MKINKMRLGKYVSGISSLIMFVLYIVLSTYEAIVISNDITTSFPWYTPFVMYGMMIIIPLILSLGLFIYFFNKCKVLK
jgi:hypothetical protein